MGQVGQTGQAFIYKGLRLSHYWDINGTDWDIPPPKKLVCEFTLGGLRSRKQSRQTFGPAPSMFYLKTISGSNLSVYAKHEYLTKHKKFYR